MNGEGAAKYAGRGDSSGACLIFAAPHTVNEVGQETIQDAAVRTVSSLSPAHGIQFDLDVDASTLRGTAVYSDQRPGARDPVMIYSPLDSESPVGSTTMAADGRFPYEASAGRTYRVAIDAGEGHLPRESGRSLIAARRVSSLPADDSHAVLP